MRVISEESSMSDQEIERRGIRLHCYNLRQQQIYTVTPLLRPKYVIPCYYFVALAFIGVGVAILASSSKVAFVDAVEYSNRPDCEVGSRFTSTKHCRISVDVQRTIHAPAYVYYQLTRFHQNYRTYVSSRSFRQLAGMWPLKEGQLRACNPITYGGEKSPDNPKGYAIPCGLTAWSAFNDTFRLCKDENCAREVDWTDEGITWDTDQDIAFQPGPSPPYSKENNTLINSPDFIVWMRLSTYARFMKLYRVIEEDLQPGTYYFDIRANYPVGSFGGTKALAISETTWFGSRKRTLGILYLCLGSATALLATIMLMKHIKSPRKMAYEDYSLVRRYLEALDSSKTTTTPAKRRPLTRR